jgi:hypothetical protein
MEEGEYIALTLELLARVGTAVVVPFERRAEGGWIAQAGLCHDNVAMWRNLHPDCEAVPGWVVSSWTGHLRFTAHSVIREPDGRFVDITPLVTDPLRPPFLPDTRSFDDFMEMITSTKLQHLDYNAQLRSVRASWLIIE